MCPRANNINRRQIIPTFWSDKDSFLMERYSAKGVFVVGNKWVGRDADRTGK